MITRKEIGCDYEAETRGFYWDAQAVRSQLYLTPDQVLISFAFPVLLKELMTEIWTRPREKSWVLPLVEKIILRYGLDISLKASNRDDDEATFAA